MSGPGHRYNTFIALIIQGGFHLGAGDIVQFGGHPGDLYPITPIILIGDHIMPIIHPAMYIVWYMQSTFIGRTEQLP